MQDQLDIAAASAAASAAKITAYGSSAVAAGVGWVMSSGLGLLISGVGVIGGLWLSWHFQKKAYDLKKLADDREHALRLLEHEARVALHNTRTRKDRP
ncbi:MAG: hypothetical protein RJA63_3089 [Pseudomonadota bacterium]|jgi:hypothetical protein